MSTELTTKIWFKGNKAPKYHLLALMKNFEKHETEKYNWKDLIITKGDLSKTKLSNTDSISSDDVLDFLKDYEDDSIHISIRSAFPCWRFENITPEKSFVPFWVEAWGKGFIQRSGRISEIEGDASFNMVNCSPFISIDESLGISNVQLVNKCVEENLEKIIELILALSNDNYSSCIKVFTDQGTYQPLNAHLVYFSDPTVIINDLSFIKKLWEKGLPEYNTLPLQNSINKVDNFAFHMWRKPDLIRNICIELKSLISNIDHLTPDDFREIDWIDFDHFKGNSGHIILNYPYFVNYFLDDFYLSLLKKV